MSNYYNDDTAISKKEKLGQSLEAIASALDSINGVTISNSWICDESEDIDTTLEALKEKIITIKAVLVTYEEFLVGINTTYSDVTDDIVSTLSSYHDEM